MLRITVGLIIACVPFAVSSHHSVRAFYDDQNVTQLEGTITRVRWINPHIHFELERVNDDGETELWDIESGSVNFLERDGVNRDDITVGTDVTVTGYSSRHGNHTMVASYVTLGNGQDIVLWPGLFGGGTAAGLRGQRTQAAADSASGGSSSFFRVWSVGPDSAGRDGAALELPLRPEARAAQAEYDPLTDDTALSCIQQGMPGIMDNPFPMQMSDRGAEILIRTEEWDVVRTVHMNGDSAATNPPATPHGYSVGRWEGETLIVETTNIDWPYFDDVGTPMSGDVEVLERYWLSENGRRLNMEMTVTDPSTFTEPVNLTGAYWLHVPGEQIKPYQCEM